MYKISEVKIDNFWYRVNVKCSFNNDVNIIIGKNGTGKTTFMDILYSVLSVDIEGLYSHEFESVEIILLNGKKKKTIRTTKVERDDVPFLYVEYMISRKKHKVRCFSGEERIPNHYKRRATEESYDLRLELAELVSLASLSVYRIRVNSEYDSRDRMLRRALTPVDTSLTDLMVRLTKYQLELSQEARVVSSKLQKDVLVSLLFKKEKESENAINLNFNKEKEKERLISAYMQLGVMDSDVRKRIKEHVNSIDITITQLKESIKVKGDDSMDIDYTPLEAFDRTKNVISMSLEAEKETNKIFSQVNEYINIVKEFILDKKFSFDGGELVIEGDDGIILYEKLSSGEKQLLILLTEALLQKQKPFVFLADEPELSLHIEWQRKIIPAIRILNPNAQIIVATHSPEIAGNFKNSIIDMGGMFCE